MTAIITAILPVLLQLLSDTPAIVDEVKSLWAFLTANTPATPEQEAAINAAYEQAYKDVESS